MSSLKKVKTARYTAGAVCAWLVIGAPALAQGFQWDTSGMPGAAPAANVRQSALTQLTAAAGQVGRTTYRTGAGPRGMHTQVPNPTSQQTTGAPMTTTMGLAPAIGGGGLPPTSLDSFVVEAGGMAELIYGDEGTDDIPPYFGFDQSHRINSGIIGNNDGLTTGHGSMLPNAVGGDEFVMPEGPSMSGANDGNPYGLSYGSGTASGPGPSSGGLSTLANSLAGSTWAQNHPRQTEVLTNDSNLYNQITAIAGSLNGNYNQLQSAALAIQNQDITDAAQNGGFITTSQQAQMDSENASLAQQIQYDSAVPDSGF
jgi:hypothetical protein